MSKAYTKEEAREQFLGHVKQLVQYWESETGYTHTKDKLSGLAFSMLVLIDGRSSMPAMDIVMRPHHEDKQYHIDNGDDYFEDGTVINDDSMLHEMFYQGEGEEMYASEEDLKPI